MLYHIFICLLAILVSFSRNLLFILSSFLSLYFFIDHMWLYALATNFLLVICSAKILSKTSSLPSFLFSSLLLSFSHSVFWCTSVLHFNMVNLSIFSSMVYSSHPEGLKIFSSIWWPHLHHVLSSQIFCFWAFFLIYFSSFYLKSLRQYHIVSITL